MTIKPAVLPPISQKSVAAEFSPVPRRGVNVATFLQQTAHRLPDSPALIDPETQTHYTWSELARRVSHTASVLIELGVKRRDAVMIVSQNHIDMVQAMWAIMHVGAVIAPPNAKLTPAEVVDLAETVQPKVVIANVEAGATVDALTDAGYADEVLWIGDPETTNRTEALDRFYYVSQHDGTRTADISSVSEDDPAWYFFTSGSTGKPKAPVFTHRHLGIVLMNHYCDLFPGETSSGASLVVAPLSHGAGIHYFAQVFSGCPSVLYNGKPFKGEDAWKLIDAFSITNMFTVPTILNRIVQAMPQGRTPDSHSLQHVIYAGAPIMAADQQRAVKQLGLCLVQYFGLGEVTGSITVLPPAEHAEIRYDDSGIGTCGRVRTGVEISIQDEHGKECKTGQSGEVCVAGPTVCGGYLNNDAANAESFAHGWFHTGDIGYMDSNGYLYLTGRKSDMYISGGSNIYPREIEEHLMAHECVSQVAVIGVPDETWGDVGVATVQGSASAAELTAFLKARLASYKIPKRFRFVAEMPTTAYGKIDRKHIRETIQAEKEDGQ